MGTHLPSQHSIQRVLKSCRKKSRQDRKRYESAETPPAKPCGYMPKSVTEKTSTAGCGAPARRSIPSEDSYYTHVLFFLQALALIFFLHSLRSDHAASSSPITISFHKKRPPDTNRMVFFCVVAWRAAIERGHGNAVPLQHAHKASRLPYEKHKPQAVWASCNSMTSSSRTSLQCFNTASGMGQLQRAYPNRKDLRVVSIPQAVWASCNA